MFWDVSGAGRCGSNGAACGEGEGWGGEGRGDNERSVFHLGVHLGVAFGC